MAFYKDERLALFIDGANLYSAARAVDLEIDFRKLLKEFQEKIKKIQGLIAELKEKEDQLHHVQRALDEIKKILTS